MAAAGLWHHLAMQPRFLASACALISFAAVACGSSSGPAAPTPPPTSTMVSAVGQVIDEAGGRTVPGVAVSWTAITQSVRVGAVSGLTDSSGTYGVWLPRAERYLVTVGGNSATIYLADPPQPVDFLMNTRGCPTVYGVVLDAVTKHPVAAADVRWVGATTTDASGRFRFDVACRPPTSFGTTLLSINKSGYVSFGTPHARAESLGSAGVLRQDYVLTPQIP